MANAGDTFVEGSDTALASHVPTGPYAGSGWTVTLGAINVIGATDLAQDNDTAGGNRGAMNTNIGTEDMDVTLNVSFSGTPVSGDFLAAGPCARLSSPTDSSAIAEFTYDWGTSGGSWLLGASVLTEAWPGGTVTMLMQCRGPVIRAYANGVLKITNTQGLGRGNRFAGIALINFNGDAAKRSQGDNFMASAPILPDYTKFPVKSLRYTNPRDIG